MRDYFRNARTVHRSALRVLETEEARASSLFAQFRDRRARVSNADFTVSRERVFFRSPAELDAEPELLLRLMQFVARHGVRLSLEADQRIAARLPAIRAHFASPRPIWPAVREALSLPHAPMALRAVHEAGALTALFPEMEQIDCLVIRDFHHRYTVDEHTLVAIQTLVQLRETKDPSARPYGGLLLEIEQPGLLLFALLFHDVGKSNGALRDSLPPRNVSHDEWARSIRSGDGRVPGAQSGNGGALEASDSRDLCGHQRGESLRHDVVARRPVVAALSAHL
jgi:[protein-PII] uridylyltransferase